MGNQKTSVKKLLLSFYKEEKKEIGVILIYGLGVGLLSLVVPVGIQTIISNVSFSVPNTSMFFLVLALFIGLGVSAILRLIQIVIVEKIQKRFFARAALDLSVNFPRVLIEGQNVGKFPQLVNRIFDIFTIQKSTSLIFLEGFALILQTAFGLLLLAFYHPTLLVFDVILVATIFIIVFVMGRSGVKTSIKESEEKYRVVAWLEEISDLSLLFHSQGARAIAIKKTDDLVMEYLNARENHFSIIYRQVFSLISLQVIASSVLLGLGGWLVTRNQLTIGQLVAAEIIVTNVLNSLSKFQKHLEAFYDLIAALDKVKSLETIPLERSSGKEVLYSEKAGELVLDQITYQTGRGRNIFKNLNLQIRAGSRFAIIGPNGSGKSTFADILYGIRPISSGVILYNGQDYREINLESLRTEIQLIRGAEIISGTIFENVRVGREKLSDDEVKNALRKVELYEEVLQLPNGLYTELNDGENLLTIGQAQKLVIARAIVGKPKVIIFDEAFEAISPKQYQNILRMLFENKSWTLVFMTQSSPLAEKCDGTFVLAAPDRMVA